MVDYEYAKWRLLLASGYLKDERYAIDADAGNEEYDLKLTNKEVHLMFQNLYLKEKGVW